MAPTNPAPRLDLVTSFTFEAAHQLPHAPDHSKCRRLHGHSWKVEVQVSGELQEETGWVIDFDDIQKACDPVYEALDHRYLNDIEGLENPTSEIIALWIWERLAAVIPDLAAVVVYETCTARCVYRGPQS
jgi:6-pyruvoyltetrahydropterin/6-carboxytetrahydropterin synthase